MGHTYCLITWKFNRESSVSTEPLLKSEAEHHMYRRSLSQGSEPSYEGLNKEADDLRSNFPLGAGLHGHEVIPTFLTEETGSCFVRTLPLGERFHCGDWGRAFVVVVGDSSQMPALQSLLFPLLHLCLFEVSHSQKIRQKPRSCKMLLPKLQLFQTFQS